MLISNINSIKTNRTLPSYSCKLCNDIIKNRIQHLENWHEKEYHEWRFSISGLGEEKEQIWLSTLFDSSNLKPVYDQRRYR